MLDPNASWLQSIETPVQGAPVIQIKAPQDVTGLAPDHPSDAQKGDVPLSGLVLSDVDVTNDIAADNVQKATTMADAKQDLAPESIIPLSRADPITESESKDFGVSEAQDLSIQEESHPLSVQEESHALSFEESQSLSLEEESVIESQPLSTGEKKETKDKETYSMSFESVSDINNQILQENSAIQEASLLLTDKPTDLEPRNVVNPLPQEIVSSKVSDPTGYGEDMDTTSLGSENPMSYAAVHSPVIESKPEPVQSTPKPKTDTPGQKNLTFEDFLAMNDLEPKKKSPKRLPEKKEILKRTNAKFAKTKEPAKQKNQVTPKRETRIGTRSADVKSRDSKIGKPTPEKPVLKERPQAQEKPQIVEKPETVESTSLDRAISDEKNVIERRLAELETLATTQKQEIHNLLERESLAKQESTELKEQVRFLEQMLEDERTSQRLVTHAKQGLLTEEEASKLRKQMEEQEHLITGVHEFTIVSSRERTVGAASEGNQSTFKRNRADALYQARNTLKGNSNTQDTALSTKWIIGSVSVQTQDQN
ncbi:hypothetical protein EDD86DRAFT_2335 [Gorgonomyces haynaldii]|nr:hypothetical protein EDD86DRAFT_2335 [Gorgonomyces haynaldii]